MIRTLNEYQEQAVATAVYPSEHRVTYPALALAGEVGEVVEKVIDKSDADSIGKEIGGVLWYLAALTQDLDAKLGDDCLRDNATFQDVQLGVKLANSFLGDDDEASDYCLGLANYTGKIANAVKKTLRGDFTVQEKRDFLLERIAECVAACAFIADCCGLSLGEIANQNIAVLTSRSERGTLLGDGDNR